MMYHSSRKMHIHTELRLTRIIFQVVIWIITISIVNSENKSQSDESIVDKGITGSNISQKIPSIGRSVYIEIHFLIEILTYPCLCMS